MLTVLIVAEEYTSGRQGALFYTRALYWQHSQQHSQIIFTIE